MVAELLRVLDLAEQDADLRCLVVTGAGSTFCAGADLTFFRQMLDSDAGCDGFMEQLLGPLVEFITRLRALPVPVIAAVNGPCVAGGLEIILCCDLVLASTEASFADAHSRHGILPAVGAVSGLVRSIGAHRAKRLLLVSGTFDATSMAEFGIVTEVVEPAELIGRVHRLTDELSSRSPASLKVIKAAVNRSEAPAWEDHVQADLEDFRAIWGTPQMREGITAYGERREPVYS
jgi:enoyl-CoA hydratase/carnithine racemase